MPRVRVGLRCTGPLCSIPAAAGGSGSEATFSTSFSDVESDWLPGDIGAGLSLPNQYADITRPARVKVRYLDQQGVRRELEADGLLAACLQHEIDHLDGILFVDHLSSLKRNMIMRRLAKEQRLKPDERTR